jgi:GNAT superfamily N-acetyltransferase
MHTDSGYVDMHSGVSHKRDYSVGYAWTEIEVAAATRAWLSIGSDDGLKIWHNGVLVHDRWARRVSQVDGDIVPLQLKAGRNQLLIKIQNATNDWSFIARLRYREKQGPSNGGRGLSPTGGVVSRVWPDLPDRPDRQQTHCPKVELRPSTCLKRPMPAVRPTLAAAVDAVELAALRNVAADDLTTRHGEGWWSAQCTAQGAVFDMRHGRTFVVRRRGLIVATFTLMTKKPWAIDRRYFTPVKRPLYLISMVVHPDCQGRGLGRACIAAAQRIALAWPAQSLCLDAWDHARAGAGPFYTKCDFREVGRATYRMARLIYYEMLLPTP